MVVANINKYIIFKFLRLELLRLKQNLEFIRGFVLKYYFVGVQIYFPSLFIIP